MNYAYVATTPLAYEDAVERARSLLRDEGFGVLCDIDVAATLKEKIGCDFRRYRILGACNPNFARQALEQEAQLGILLPCNVVVQELDDEVIVSAVDATALLSLVDNPELTGIADEINGRLQRVLDALSAKPQVKS